MPSSPFLFSEERRKESEVGINGPTVENVYTSSSRLLSFACTRDTEESKWVIEQRTHRAQEGLLLQRENEEATAQSSYFPPSRLLLLFFWLRICERRRPRPRFRLVRARTEGTEAVNRKSGWSVGQAGRQASYRKIYTGHRLISLLLLPRPFRCGRDGDRAT